ncbi:MAG: 5-dehydro-4-deoxy-D-glucuronate isomerase [Deltaproteobacteria bacterium]|jgi:4-deoxy-L-threo-5-hexosulose-uronate ketol-isomerase|nr:5-dehydro-4-deoxy-D-glucuronate isomerase [Deltaproteobacteria bacterium]
METREAVHPEHAKRFDTDELRRHFLVSGLFPENDARMVYTYYDRLIVGGTGPVKPVSLSVDPKILGAASLLERREMGIINIGAPGTVIVDGKKHDMAERDGLYVGKGARDIVFLSASASSPAKFYFNCVPAHEALPTTKMTFKDAAPLRLGSDAQSNKRTIYKYFHPDGIKTCQLVMGMTLLEPNNVWNTMPVHTHKRRMEAYFYFNLPPQGIVFQIVGEPAQTRHIVVRNEEAVLHPSWSIHSGVGTTNYTFIWGMAGENQTFSDMDEVPVGDLR